MTAGDDVSGTGDGRPSISVTLQHLDAMRCERFSRTMPYPVVYRPPSTVISHDLRPHFPNYPCAVRTAWFLFLFARRL